MSKRILNLLFDYMNLNRSIQNILSFKRSRRFIFIILPIIVIFFGIIFAIFGSFFTRLVHASFGSWGDTSLINACEDSRGRVTLVSAGTNCNANESQVTWLKDVDAGAGLSISRSSSGATISLDSSSSSSPSAYEVLATDGQTTTSTTFSNMTNGTQSVTLTTKSIIYVNAHTNAFTTGGGQIAYIRTVYNDGSDHEIGTQGYTNATADGQSITAGGVVTLDPGTYTFAIQKKLYVNGGTSTFYQPSMAIMVVPIQ